MQAVAAAELRGERKEGRRRHPHLRAGAEGGQAQRQRARPAGAVAGHVFHHHSGARGHSKPLQRTGVLEVEASSSLAGGAVRRRRPGQAVTEGRQAVRHPGGVGDHPAGVGARQVEAVRHRRAPAVADRRQAAAHPQQAAHRAGVAIGVPAGGVGDQQRPVEVAGAGQERQDDQRVVGHHVAVAAVAVVAVALADAAEGVPPAVTAVGLVPLAHVVDQAGNDRVAGNEGQRRVQQALDVGLGERRRLHCRHRLGAVDRGAVGGDAGRAARQIGRQLRVARRRQRPAIDEDLGRDLLCDYLPVGRRGAARRWLQPPLEAQIRGVGGGVAEAAPPQHRAFLDQIVQPGAADRRRGNLPAARFVLQGADEDEGARDVVVRHDQGPAEALVHVTGDLPQLRLDPLVQPTLDRAPQVDADDLAEHPGVDPLGIVRRQRRRRQLVCSHGSGARYPIRVRSRSAAAQRSVPRGRGLSERRRQGTIGA